MRSVSTAYHHRTAAPTKPAIAITARALQVAVFAPSVLSSKLASKEMVKPGWCSFTCLIAAACFDTAALGHPHFILVSFTQVSRVGRVGRMGSVFSSVAAAVVGDAASASTN